MARTELHSSKLPPVAQRRRILPNATAAVPELVTGETIRSIDGTYLADLAMLEEPVTIRIEPSAEKNAARSYPVWVNGKGAECFLGGRWVEIIYLPVAIDLIVKRKYLGVIIGAKTDNVSTKVIDGGDDDRPRNITERITTAVMSFSILEDRNPRGPAWVAALRQRHL
jgi:hypothetical protein